MTKRRIIGAIGFIAAWAALGGCSGVLRSPANAIDIATTQAASSTTPTPQAADNNSSYNKNDAAGQVVFSTSGATEPTGWVESLVSSAGEEFAVVAVSPLNRSFNSFTLYGQLPRQTAAPTSAPPSSNPENIRQITSTTEGADFNPDIDPTGQWLVYASTRHRATSSIYLQRVDGSSVIQLTNERANDAMPAFSPDGKRIAFCSDRSGNWDIYLMPVDGGQPVQITNGPAQSIHPSFSPDGRFLVYSSQSTQSRQWELVVVDLEKPANKCYLGVGLFPHWSPVDNKIVFQRARERGTRWFSLWTIDVVNGEGVRPTEIAASSNAACITPHWSADGKRIVFCTVVDPDAGNDPHSQPPQADVWIVNADGSDRTNLTQNRFVNVEPVWSRDGTIYFAACRPNNSPETIWSLRPDRALMSSLPSVGVKPAAAVGPTARLP